MKGKRKLLREGKKKVKKREGEKTFERFGLLIVNWKFLFFYDIHFEAKPPSGNTITDLLFKHKYYLYQRRKISGVIIFIIKERHVRKTHFYNFGKNWTLFYGNKRGKSAAFLILFTYGNYGSLKKFLIRILQYVHESSLKMNCCIKFFMVTLPA